MTPMPMMMLCNLFLFGFFGFLAALLDNFNIIVEYSRDDRDHISLDHPSPYVLSPTNSYVNNTLESEIPFPHVHHILASPLFQNAYQPLDATIDR